MKKNNSNSREEDDGDDEEARRVPFARACGPLKDSCALVAPASKASTIDDPASSLIFSGESKHICCDSSMFSSMSSGRNESAMLGEDTKIQTKGVESVSIKLKAGKNLIPVTFAEVLCVPELGTNLISCGGLGRAGIQSTFDRLECLLKNIRASYKVIGR